MKNESDLLSTLNQYIDGALTYIELVRIFSSKVTEYDVREHNSLAPGDGFRAEWPFQG